MRRVAMVAGLVLLLMGALSPAALAKPKGPKHAPFAVSVESGITYGQGQVNRPTPGKLDLKLDLYRPVTRSKRRRPAVVLIHGGGFTGGSRSAGDMVTIARGLAARGNVVASIDYRLGPQDPVPSSRVAAVDATFPEVSVFEAMTAAIDDTLTALDWVRHNAKRRRMDVKRLGIAGESAGGITADHVAYALDDLGIKVPRFRFAGSLWGGIFIDIGAEAAQLEAGEAALFAVHGAADTVVPVFLDDRLVTRARSVGVPSEYYRVDGAGHGARAVGFFTREVRPGQTAFDRFLGFADAKLDRRNGHRR